MDAWKTTLKALNYKTPKNIASLCMCRVPTQLISLSLARSLTLHCVVLYIFEFYIFGKNTLIFLNMLTSARDNFHQRKTSYNVLCVGIELFYPYFVCIKFRANYKLKFNRYTYIFAYRPSKGIVWPTSTGCIENKNSIVLFFLIHLSLRSFLTIFDAVKNP